jgi:DNA-binding transcriptional MerR regulator
MSEPVDKDAMQVGEVAKLVHLSVRTLHHYDATGLVSPSARSEAGYRLYSLRDLERLQQVLFYKELGFGLREIASLLSEPGANRFDALTTQRGLIAKRIERLGAMRDLIDRTLASLEEGVPMRPEEMFEVFGDFDPSQYEAEVKQRWGNTDAYRESARRTSRYARKDWERIRDENAALMHRMIDAFDRGVAPKASEAMEIAEQARLAIDRAFYPCSHETHCALAQMYVTDPRFRDHYDRERAGLAAWFAAAIRANAQRSDQSKMAD